MFPPIPNWMICLWVFTVAVNIAIVLRRKWIRKKDGIAGLESLMKTFADDKELVEHSKQQLEIARNKSFLRF